MSTGGRGVTVTRTTKKPPGVPRPRTGVVPKGRHVIDLTEGALSDARLDDYRAAFGLPSSLHEVPPPVEAHRHGLGRLQSLFPRRRA